MSLGKVRRILLRLRMRRKGDDVLIGRDLTQALENLQKDFGPAGSDKLGKIFIIGGSEIYAAAMGLVGTTRRVLQTQIRKKDGGKIDCDTFFPSFGQNEWQRMTREETSEWAGEVLPQGDELDGEMWTSDGDFEVRVSGWEKEVVPQEN